jgi:hypothetical protein
MSQPSGRLLKNRSCRREKLRTPISPGSKHTVRCRTYEGGLVGLQLLPNQKVSEELVNQTHRPHDFGGGKFDVLNGHLECSCARGRTNETTEIMMYSDGEARSKASFINEIGWRNNPKPNRSWNLTGCADSGTCRYDRKHAESLMPLLHDWVQAK